MAAIESPCNNVCTLDKAGELCIGCGRTLAEIRAWATLSSDQRTRIMSDLSRRLDLLSERRRAQARGG